MKLSTSEIEHAEDQLQATAISESAGVMRELRDLYGDHTFFVDPEGLHILEWFDDNQPADGREVLTAVQLASWSDVRSDTVATHPPRKTDKLVVVKGGPGATGA